MLIGMGVVSLVGGRGLATIAAPRDTPWERVMLTRVVWIRVVRRKYHGEEIWCT